MSRRPRDVGVLDDPVRELDDGRRVLALEVGRLEVAALGVGLVGVADHLGHGADVDVVATGGGL
jgi:hypothetical protein